MTSEIRKLIFQFQSQNFDLNYLHIAVFKGFKSFLLKTETGKQDEIFIKSWFNICTSKSLTSIIIVQYKSVGTSIQSLRLRGFVRIEGAARIPPPNFRKLLTPLTVYIPAKAALYKYRGFLPTATFGPGEKSH